MDIKEWAANALADELVWTREASTAGRRAWHEGVAAALAMETGNRQDAERGKNLLVMILVDYAGVRATEGRRGYAVGVHMIRGVASYLKATGDVVVDEWAAGAVANAAGE